MDYANKTVLTQEQAKRIQQETGLEQIIIFGWSPDKPNQIQYVANKGDNLILTLIEATKNKVGIDRRFLLGIRRVLDYIEGNK